MNPFAIGLAAAAIGGYRAFRNKAKHFAHLQEHTKHLATISGAFKGLKERGHTKVPLTQFYEEHLRPRGVPEKVFESVFSGTKYGWFDIDEALKRVEEHMRLNKFIKKDIAKTMGSPTVAGIKSAFKWGLGAAAVTALGQKTYESLSAPPQPAFISPDYQEEMETLMRFV